MLEFHKLGFPAACFRLCGSTSRKSETPVGDAISMLSMMNYIEQIKVEESRLDERKEYKKSWWGAEDL